MSDWNEADEDRAAWTEAHRRQRAEERRAVRAERHLRDALDLLAEIWQVADDSTLRARIEAVSASRMPAVCGLNMSCYSTCDLGTRGCLGYHEDDDQAADPSGRLTIRVKIGGGS